MTGADVEGTQADGTQTEAADGSEAEAADGTEAEAADGTQAEAADDQFPQTVAVFPIVACIKTPQSKTFMTIKTNRLKHGVALRCFSDTLIMLSVPSMVGNSVKLAQKQPLPYTLQRVELFGGKFMDSPFTDTGAVELLLMEHLPIIKQYNKMTCKQKTKHWENIKKKLLDNKFTISDPGRKFRRLEAKYKEVKNNNGKTGRGRKSWKYFDLFDDLVRQHQTVAYSPTCTSSAGESSTGETRAVRKRSHAGVPGRKSGAKQETLSELKRFHTESLELQRQALEEERRKNREFMDFLRSNK